MTSLAHVVPFESEPPRVEALRRLAEAVRTSAAALEVAAAALLVVADEPPPPTPQDEDPMLTVEEAATELRRSSRHVRAACQRGAIKALKDARGYRIRRSALRRYEIRRTA